MRAPLELSSVSVTALLIMLFLEGSLEGVMLQQGGASSLGVRVRVCGCIIQPAVLGSAAECVTHGTCQSMSGIAHLVVVPQ